MVPQCRRQNICPVGVCGHGQDFSHRLRGARGAASEAGDGGSVRHAHGQGGDGAHPRRDGGGNGAQPHLRAERGRFRRGRKRGDRRAADAQFHQAGKNRRAHPPDRRGRSVHDRGGRVARPSQFRREMPLFGGRGPASARQRLVAGFWRIPITRSRRSCGRRRTTPLSA